MLKKLKKALGIKNTTKKSSNKSGSSKNKNTAKKTTPKKVNKSSSLKKTGPSKKNGGIKKDKKKTVEKKVQVKKNEKKKSPAVRKKTIVKRHYPIKAPFQAYSGGKPYIFISYAHKDIQEVFKIIEKLNEKNIRIWYDEGIEPGNEWPEIVGAAIENCGQFLVFMSPYATNSRNVRNEINLAFNEGKEIIVVQLRKTRLSGGMKLQLGTVQFINRFELTAPAFFEKLNAVLKSDVKN